MNESFKLAVFKSKYFNTLIFTKNGESVDRFLKKYVFLLKERNRDDLENSKKKKEVISGKVLI